MSTTAATDLQAKAKETAERFLVRRGYEILERDWECDCGSVDLICYDDEEEALVLVDVAVREAGNLPEQVMSASARRRREGQACAYLAQSPDVPIECRVRFDAIAMVVVNPVRVLLRHIINMGI